MTRDFPIVVCSVLVVVRVLVRGAGAGAGSEVVCMLLVVVVTGFSGSEVLPGVLGEFVGFHMSSNPFTVLLREFAFITGMYNAKWFSALSILKSRIHPNFTNPGWH